MTLDQVAERLHCSTRTVRRRIAEGELRASHHGRGLWEISEDDLQAYLDAHANRPRDIRPLPGPAAQPIQPVTAARRPRRSGSDRRLSDLLKDKAA